MKPLLFLLAPLVLTACNTTDSSEEGEQPPNPTHCSEGNIVNYDDERKGYSFVIENCFGMTYYSEHYGRYGTDWIAAYGTDFRYWSETYQYQRFFMEEADELGKHYYQLIPSGSWAGMVAITTSYYDGSEYTDYYSHRSDEYNHYDQMTVQEPHKERFNTALKHATIIQTSL